MSNCPRCTTLVKFPTDHNSRWYKCPECSGYLRELSLPNSGLTRVELGKTVPGGISPLLPGSFDVRPASRVSTIPRNVIPIPQPAQQNRTKTNSIPSDNANKSRLSSPIKPAILNNITDIVQVRARRRQIANEILNLEEQNKNLLKDLLQEKDNQQSVDFIASKLIEYSNNREKFIEELGELDTRENSYLANKSKTPAQELKVQYISTPSAKKEPIPFGYSAFVGIGAMIWFTLSIGVQQWELKTVLMMLGVGVGVALVGWFTGSANK